jgi:transitional endoplasmic reticulum ATPase
MQRRGRLRRKLGRAVFPDAKHDKNERFVLKSCAEYLLKHLNRYPFLGRESLAMICWTLDEKKEEISEYLLDQLGNDDERNQYELDLLECGQDSDDYARELFRILQKTKKSNVVRQLNKIITQLLKQQIEQARHNRNSDVENNLSTIKAMFNLTDQETDFCVLLFILSTYEPAEEFFVNHLGCNKFLGRKYLLNILGMSQKQLNIILVGVLRKIDMFEMDKFDLKLNDEFLNLFQEPSSNDFSSKFFSRIPEGEIPLEHYFLKDGQTEYILNLLKAKPETGTHILLYGPPGTGKTSFAHGLATNLKIPAFTVAQGEENTSQNRRAAILASLNMTNTGEGSLIVVDEADNLLNTGTSWFMRGETQDKGWLNRLLEVPEVRMIWITNRIDDIDKSVLRRFAFSLHFRSFSKRQRIQLWENIVCKNKVERFLDESDIKSLASKFVVSAGAIDLAVKKAVEANANSKNEFQKAIELALNAHQTLMNTGNEFKGNDGVKDDYTLEGLNIEGDINLVLRQLNGFDHYIRNFENSHGVNMNLLFYGPPGTGKSELGRYIASYLDKEIICKRASDLKSKWVGESEKNLKAAFEEAGANDAILLIDEVDSMLFSRDRAERSWEISFTNEFLTQMERFSGIMICTTNRMTDLDAASIRRFNHKIGFDFLTSQGNLIFYETLISPLLSVPLSEKLKLELKEIKGLAPGDFKIVRDRFAFFPEEELKHEEMVNALNHEANLKNIHQGSIAIGF